MTKTLKIVNIHDQFLVTPDQERFMVEAWATLVKYDKRMHKLVTEFREVAMFGTKMGGYYYETPRSYGFKLYTARNIAVKQFDLLKDLGMRCRLVPMYLIPDRDLTLAANGATMPS